MKRALTFCAAVMVASCSRHHAPPPPPGAASAPTLRSVTVLLLPVQEGAVPSPDTAARHWPVDRGALDREIAYWLQQGRTSARWVLPATIDRSIERSPTLGVRPHELAVAIFQQAQVKRIGDPLFGDLHRLAAVYDASVALIPVAAEWVGADPNEATVQIAAALINVTDGTVIWFGVIAGREKGMRSAAAVASAAQAFAKAFAEKNQAGEN